MITSYQSLPMRINQTRLAQQSGVPESLASYLRQKEKDIDNLYAILQTFLVSRMLIGPAAERPAAGTPGRFFLTTDTNTLYVDNGSQWVAA